MSAQHRTALLSNSYYVDPATSPAGPGDTRSKSHSQSQSKSRHRSEAEGTPLLTSRYHGPLFEVNPLLPRRITRILALVALLWSIYTIFAQIPLRRRKTIEVKGTSFLNHEALIGGLAGASFLRHNIPLIDIPDPLVQDVYYYRWTSLQRNLRYVRPGIGYMCTEFVQPVSYAKAFGSIDAAAGHQIDEARWLKDTFFVDDYIQLFTRGPADTSQYTQWILDAMTRRAMVTGDRAFLSHQLNDMIRVWHEWDHVFDKAAGLYYYQPVWDAQELSLPGFVVDPNNTNWNLRKDGPDTFRPSHNAYMAANARAVATAANFAHDGSTAAKFTKLADDLENAIHQRMWATEQRFFMDIIRPGNPNLTPLSGREQVGLFPYRFGIGLNRSYAQPAVDAMFDTDGFLAPFGPTTLEIRDPWFMATRPNDYCCYWNGMSWPFSTSHTLKSLATIFRAGTTNATADQYYHYLRTYAQTQQKNQRPYVAESHYPFENAWSADSWNHSEHYAHSTNNDDVITGLLGILPQFDDALHISPIIPQDWTYFALENLPYHGHLVTVLYDKDGERYGVGKGLTVFVNGNKVHNGVGQAAIVRVPRPILRGDALVNIAANPTGPGQYPMANATFTNPGDDSYKAIDGVLFYDNIPDNRWTNYRSPNTNDTLTITFARPRNVSSVTIALYSDAARGGRIDLPSSIEIYGSSGLAFALDNSTELLANDRSHLKFDRVETEFLAINMHRKSQQVFVGVCELEVWTAAEAGPVYYAVDAYLTGTQTRVVFDKSAKATANGAVVGGVRPDSNVAFSGIVSDGRPSTLTLSYSNLGNAATTLGVEVNQVPLTTISLLPSGGTYLQATANVTLAVGKNYVSLKGGSDSADIRLETIALS
ncbi:Six-hairpin glycosidase-like protein [Biscogniauxia mediterranea]|nr:Six-hairpin glycosidase-like protein [Biscogniauxia mediterranea]